MKSFLVSFFTGIFIITWLVTACGGQGAGTSVTTREYVGNIGIGFAIENGLDLAADNCVQLFKYTTNGIPTTRIDFFAVSCPTRGLDAAQSKFSLLLRIVSSTERAIISDDGSKTYGTVRRDNLTNADILEALCNFGGSFPCSVQTERATNSHFVRFNP